METTMQYKTIILELLQQRPLMLEELRKERKVLATLEQYAQELKTSHETWQEQLATQKPASHPSQIASEALEMALQELEERLPTESLQDETETLSLDEAMATIRRPTSRG
jgi:hypothetical protein